MDRVLIIDADYDRLDRSITTIFEFFKLDFENKRVFVKPNMLSPRRPKEHVTTHPALVRAVCRELGVCKARVIVGDNHSGELRVRNETVAQQTGILDASQGNFRNIGKSSRCVNDFSKLIGELPVSSEILDCDLLISLPKFKTHALTTITGAIKNMFGIVPGGMKSQLHFRFASPTDFAQILIDIYKIRPPDLTIMDAVVGMEGLGPGGGGLRSIGKIIASNNGAALDLIMARMMGIKPEKVLHLKYAIEQGLVKPDQIDITGDAGPIKKFRLPPTFPSKGIFKYVYDKVIHGYHIGWLPCVNPGTCKICKSCVNVCPSRAMVDGGKLAPKVEVKKCILCYCCIEICPYQAIHPKLYLFRRWH